MTDFALTWNLTRTRFGDSLTGLSHAQLNWRLHDEALTIAEMALHVAGVEISFTTQLLDVVPTGLAARLKQAATDGTINDKPFPFEVSEMTAELIAEALELARETVEPILTNPTEELRRKEIVSALGPTINGDGAFVRLGFHPGYHHGQIHLIKTAPGFPK